MNWMIQKLCTDVQDYELTIEHEKNQWHCEQKRESWKWRIAYHGSIVASGSVNSLEEAKIQATAAVPAG